MIHLEMAMGKFYLSVDVLTYSGGIIFEFLSGTQPI